MKVKTGATSLGLISALLVGGAAMSGCEAPDRTDRFVAANQVDFRLTQSTQQILVGEVVTVTAQADNILGRDTNVEWFSTGGELTEEAGGRVARVRFNNPGTYTISARLHVDGERILTDSIDVRVRELR